MTGFSRRSVLRALGAAGAASAASGVALSAAPAPAGAAGSGSPDHGRVPDDLRPGGAYDRFVAELAERDEFSGTILVSQRGRTVLSRSYGLADKEREIPNARDTIFATGSVTKLFTAIAVVQLAEREQLRFHQTVGEFLDGFAPEVADAVTVHHLLIHTSGLGDYVQTDAWKEGRQVWDSPEEIMAGISGIVRGQPAPAVPPGDAEAYSNSGYHVLGEIVAAVSGQPYYDYVREHVFGSADMTDADFYTKPAWRDDPRIAIPYTLDAAGDRVDALDQLPYTGAPAGNAHATADGLAGFARALDDDDLLGSLYRGIYLDTKRPGLWSDTQDMPSQVKFNTYGPHALLVNEQWGLGHNGGAPGIGAYLEWYPAQDIVSVVLCNYDAQMTSTIAATARRIAMGGDW
ncbi:serine hydrolase domain-containing protein [Jiangella asiatica]|uniref:serine hydrolase domain-containing protein n=1 Tax=Jiangella asiatica TaxID=2530372 RepID=UPI0013A5CF0C|nr:serine hydrolase domain-containing protein [Jiangella asiatica]